MEQEYRRLYTECITSVRPDILSIFEKRWLESNHTLICSEEPDIIASMYFKTHYGGEYSLTPIVINVNLDSEYMDITYHLAKPLCHGIYESVKNTVGHFEFDMATYPRNKLYYVLESVIQPIISTQDIGKLITTDDESTCSKKIVYLKNLDVAFRNAYDTKVYNKMLCWLEKYIGTTHFFISVHLLNQSLFLAYKPFCHYLLFKRIRNLDVRVFPIIEQWLQTHFHTNEFEWNILRFPSFRHYMRHCVAPDIYSDIEQLLCVLLDTSIADSEKYVQMREWMIQWLNQNRSHQELMYCIFHAMKTQQIPYNYEFIEALNDAFALLYSGKKTVIHLEHVLTCVMQLVGHSST
jgi:hypothetical protein